MTVWLMNGEAAFPNEKENAADGKEGEGKGK